MSINSFTGIYPKSPNTGGSYYHYDKELCYVLILQLVTYCMFILMWSNIIVCSILEHLIFNLVDLHCMHYVKIFECATLL